MTKRAWAIGLFVAIALIVALYRAKYGARESLAEKRDLQAEVAALEEELRVLRSEFAHLSRPEWLSEYARRNLGMAPPRADQFIGPEDLSPEPTEEVAR